MTAYCLGWDVGSWQCSGESKDALVLLAVEPGSISIMGEAFRDNLLSKLDYSMTLDGILSLLKVEQRPDPLVIAVDAVFGWPVAFRQLAEGKPTYVHSAAAKNLDNRYLYRETERFLGEQFTFGEHPPMTAVGDAIGGAATKAQDVLGRLRSAVDCYVPPLDPWVSERAQNAKLTIIEVYPGATKHSKAFQALRVPDGTTVAHLAKGDPQDALRCALNGACYAATVGIIERHDLPAVFTPDDFHEQEKGEILRLEGWIFAPKP